MATAVNLIRNRIAQSQNEIQLRQEQKLSTVGTLASGMAHEINNPLTGIINFAHLIKEELAADQANLKNYSECIVREGLRINQIIKSLLTFARQGKQSFQTENISDLIEGIMVLVKRLFHKDSINFKIKLAENLPLVSCIAPQIQQVLLNLLTNARDAVNARHPGTKENKNIELTAVLEEKFSIHFVTIGVHDNGSGIQEKDYEKIFDPFFTTKPAGSGTGLGLSISYGIIQEHGGRIWFESRPEQGTDFYFSLPTIHPD